MLQDFQEGREMDLFVDKLSEKTTAQEIIKANTAADIRELNRWKVHAEENRECLAKMEALVDRGVEKMALSLTDLGILQGITRENADRIKAMQESLESLGESVENLRERIGDAETRFSTGMESVTRVLEEKKDTPSQDVMMEKLDLVDENVHKECVKVYRNVQAVVQEENAKAGDELKLSVRENGKKARTAMVCAILAMLFSLAGVVLQILNMLHVF